jgi:hypothetical protein
MFGFARKGLNRQKTDASTGMHCVLLLTMLLLSGCSAGGCTLPNGHHADVFACMQE